MASTRARMSYERAGVASAQAAWQFVQADDRRQLVRAVSDRYSTGGESALVRRRTKLFAKVAPTVGDAAEVYALSVALSRIRGGAAGS
jgi:hypothetical protein